MKRIGLVIAMLLTGTCMLPAQLPNPLNLPDPLGITDSNPNQSGPPRQDQGRPRVRQRYYKRRYPRQRYQRPYVKRRRYQN